MPFSKMQGIGNDFVVLDALRGDLPSVDPVALAPLVCERRRGVGGDGILLVERGDTAPFRMRMWNPDGSESEMCGNGLRCAAVLLRERGYASETAEIETGAGVLKVRFIGEDVAVDMGIARLSRGQIGMAGAPEEQFVEADLGEGTLATAVSMGNPHLVVFVDDVDSVDLEPRGRHLERHTVFPQRTNVHFVQVLSPDEVKVRVWERGAGATLACGTGACAVAVAGVETGRLARRATVNLPGGPLTIEVAEDRRVTMTGPAVTVFEGKWGS
ncbi:diaminopimelate epimerase [bacterium]|nr:MAG: diaminopimelate epimerase [bacterium]